MDPKNTFHAVALLIALLSGLSAQARNSEGPYLEFGEEEACNEPRMKYQKDFSALLSKLKPKDFGSLEYFAKKKGDGYEVCDARTQKAADIESLKDVAGLANAADEFKANYERDIKCILSAQSKFPDMHEPGGGFNYGACSNPSSAANQKKSKGYRPCRTRENAEVMALSVKLVANCAGIRESDMFPLLQHEGGFNLNVISSTGAAGVGQLVADTIGMVKGGGAEEYEQVNQAILGHKFPSRLPGVSCDLLKPYLDMFPKNSKSDCEMMSPPKNPLMSLMITAKLFKSHHVEFDRLTKAMIELYKLDKPPIEEAYRMDQKAQEKLTRAMYLWAYNGGLGGIRSQFADFMYRTYVQRLPFEYGKPITKTVTKRVKVMVSPADRKHKRKAVYKWEDKQVSVDSYPTKKFTTASVDDLITGMEHYLQKHYPNPKNNRKRSIEVAKYYGAIERDLNKTNAKVGGSCFGSDVAEETPVEDAGDTQ